MRGVFSKSCKGVIGCLQGTLGMLIGHTQLFPKQAHVQQRKFRMWSTSNGIEAIVVVLFKLSGSVLAILLQSHQYYINI